MTEQDVAPAPEAPAVAAVSRKRLAFKIAVRLVILGGVLAFGWFVLVGIFDDLDLAEVRSAMSELSDAERAALLMGWLLWIGAQGLQTASLVSKLPARRGALAYLGPSAVASIVPGPSDLPVRYSMYQSWGISNREAGTALAANGIFSVGSQLALPAFAGVAIALSGVQIAGFFSIIVTATVVLAVVIVLAVVVLRSEALTRKMGNLADGPAHKLAKLFRKDSPSRPLGDIVTEQRDQARDHLSDKWQAATAATVLTVVAKCALLVLSLRFVGIPEADLSWSAIFAVFALVAGLTIIPITPGSAGVSEIALVGMLAPIAGSQWVNQVAAGVLVYRLLTWLVLIPVGFGVLGWWRFSLRRLRGTSSPES